MPITTLYKHTENIKQKARTSCTGFTFNTAID